MDLHSTVTLSVELKEVIQNSMREFLDSHPGWDQNRVINAGVALFLIQNLPNLSSGNYQACSQAYLQSVCSFPD